MPKRHLVLAALLLQWTVPVYAAQGTGTAATAGEVKQSEANAVTQNKAASALREKLFQVAAKIKTPIFEERAVPLEFEIKAAPDLAEPVSIAGVTAEGFTRYVTVDGEKVGQAVVTRLRKDKRFVDLNAEHFTTQFKVDDPEIKPEEILDINGHEGEFVAALKKLHEDPENEKDEEKKEEEKDKEKQQVQGDSGRKSGGGAGGARSGQQQSAYKTPERRKDEKKTPAKSEVRTTTEGCKVVVDLAQGVVRQQSKTQTFEDGVMTSEEACSDSGTNFTIQKSYSGCTDFVDIDKMQAQPQYVQYYLDDKAARHELGECQPDTDKTFTITEAEKCPLDLDLEKGVARVQTSLVYTNANNNLQTVRECQPSKTIPEIKMTKTAEGCTMRHDFAGGKSTEMAMWTYEKGGQYFQGSPCMTTENTYTHKKVFKSGGVDVCEFIVNLAGLEATPQYRTQITVDGSPRYISDCTPDESANVAIKATTDTCMNPALFNHDLSAGVSYGMERFYYDNPSRVYVSACQQSKTTFAHNVEVTNWKYDDENKTAMPLSTVTISVDGSSYPVATDTILAGSEAVAYTLSEKKNVLQEDKKYYEKCIGFVPTKDVEVYQRPDETTYEFVIGDGEVKNLGDLCHRTKETKSNLDRAELSYGGYGGVGYRGRTGSGQAFAERIAGGHTRKLSGSNGPYRVTNVIVIHSCDTVRWWLKHIYAHYERTRTVLPDGRIEVSAWTKTREETESSTGSRTTNCPDDD
ncbi:hypothetical protein [Polycladidibacter hongkongensis]|uniref:hypothetical protein n=1 Tax=Polycladidibacter hongkongensis TaxID=1647556 RepID=UPI000830042E|nr:hypothetical protein [Pseudovibrio hongkongensis]